MSAVDFGRHSEDYAAYRPGFPASFYRRIDAIIPIRGTRSLDLATGPGTIALELASRGSSVVGVDISAELIDTATRIAKQRNLEDHTHFMMARAEHTGLDADAFDLVTAGQCWHWFDHNAALAETRRVLRPGGILVIAYYSYLAAYSTVVRETENLILKFNPSWTMGGSTGVFPGLIDGVILGGFQFIEAFCYDHEETFSHAAWRGRMRTCNGVGSGNLSASEVRQFDEALRDMLDKKFLDPFSVMHRVWCVVARKAS